MITRILSKGRKKGQSQKRSKQRAEVRKCQGQREIKDAKLLDLKREKGS